MQQDRPLKEDLGEENRGGGNKKKSEMMRKVEHSFLYAPSEELLRLVLLGQSLLRSGKCGLHSLTFVVRECFLGSEKGTGSNWENNSQTSDDRTITAVLDTLNSLVNGDTQEVCILNIVTYVYKPLERTLLTCLSAFMRVQMAKHFLCVGEFIKFIGLNKDKPPLKHMSELLTQNGGER